MNPWNGAIGLKVAEIGRAFGLRLLAYSRTEREAAKAFGVRYTGLGDLLARSDIITLHVPLNDSTRALIGQKRISLMKPSSILINTARGPVVDNRALAEALKEGRIAGAGIDVYGKEPPLEEDNPILSAPNTLLSPHVAFATERRAGIAFGNVISWLGGVERNTVV